MDTDIKSEFIIDAKKLKDNNIQKRRIKEIVVEIIKKINDEIIDAHRQGQHIIITELPIIFDIPNMLNKDRQRTVWAKVISILKNKNYRVALNYTNDYCKLKITWMSEQDEIDIKSEIQLLAESKKKF
jgi:hypothetical protein